MPLVNTWIKNEDWDTYYQLASNKQWGEFIHKALNSGKLVQPKTKIIEEIGKKIIKPEQKAAQEHAEAIINRVQGPKVINTVEAVKEIFPEAGVVKPKEEPVTYKKTSNWGA